MASCGMVVVPFGNKMGLTSTSIQEIGTFKRQNNNHNKGYVCNIFVLFLRQRSVLQHLQFLDRFRHLGLNKSKKYSFNMV